MKYLALAIVLLLPGCAGLFNQTEPVEPITISAEPIDPIPLVLPEVDTVRSRDVNWIVLTPENVDQVFAELAEEGGAVVVFAISVEDYENLSLNTREALQIIRQQQAVIDGYREYYLVTQRQIADHNRSLEE